MSESGDRIPSGDPPQKISCGDPLCPCQDGDVCNYVTVGNIKAMMIPVSRHEKNLRQLRCAVAMSRFITLHHCHGGSVQEAGWHVGMGQKQNPFLQIPLEFKYHVGHLGIDSGYGVQSWELEFGTQMEHLQWVNEQLDYDIWEQAKLWNRENWKSTIKVESYLS